MEVHNAKWNLSTAQKERLDKRFLDEYRMKLRAHYDLITQLNHNNPKLFWLIYAIISVDSVERIRAHLLSDFNQLHCLPINNDELNRPGVRKSKISYC